MADDLEGRTVPGLAHRVEEHTARWLFTQS